MTTTVVGRANAATPVIAIGAWSLIASGLLTIVLGIPLASAQNETPFPWPIAALNALSHLLMIAGVIGVGISGAAGAGRLGRAGLMLTGLGLSVVAMAEVIAVAAYDVAIVFWSIATLLMIIGLIVTGIAVLRAGRWTSWRRFTPVLCGLFLLLVVSPSFAFPGFASNYAIGGWGVCWLLLGLALHREAGHTGAAWEAS